MLRKCFISTITYFTKPSGFGSYCTSSSFSLTSLVLACTNILLGFFLSTKICLLEARGSLTSPNLSFFSLVAARSLVDPAASPVTFFYIGDRF